MPTKYPEIDKLKVNDVIIVPAIEDLDPAYIDPPRARASLGTARKSGGRSRAGAEDTADGVADSSVSSSAATRGEPISTARTNGDSGDAVPVRRSSRTDPDLDLPAPDAVSRRDTAPDRTGRRIDRPLGDDDANDEPETRNAARPARPPRLPEGDRSTRSASTIRCGPSPATCWATPTAPARSSISTAT